MEVQPETSLPYSLNQIDQRCSKSHRRFHQALVSRDNKTQKILRRIGSGLEKGSYIGITAEDLVQYDDIGGRLTGRSRVGNLESRSILHAGLFRKFVCLLDCR